MVAEIFQTSLRDLPGRRSHLGGLVSRSRGPNAELLLFPNGKTKFVRPDGSIGKEPGTGVVLIGMGEIANTALERSGLGFFVRLRGTP